MPKYTFQCTCGVKFDRNLKMGEHKKHPCPDCSKPAPRKWAGQGFGFGFAPGKTPGNSGVTKDDYPTADHLVGRSAEVRWSEIESRNEVKARVREGGGTHALIRRHGGEKGQTYTEYTAMSKDGLKVRKAIGKAADKVVSEVGMPETALSHAPPTSGR